jgi:hypothetical protein
MANLGRQTILLPAPSGEVDAAFQPGQVGIRHLLGVMTGAAIVVGVSAARLRTMTTVEAGQVAIHWLYVLAVAGGGYGGQVFWQRRVQRASGHIWLRVLQKPVTESRRRFIRWLLTAAVVLDGIFISLAVAPGRTLGEALKSTYILTLLIQLPMMEGWLWLACIRHWLTNPYWVEFREHGILTRVGFFPWKSMSRIGWSSVLPHNLAFVCRRTLVGLPIDPASHQAVDKVLEHVRSHAEVL